MTSKNNNNLKFRDFGDIFAFKVKEIYKLKKKDCLK